LFYDLIEATVEQIKIGGWVMGPLVVLSLWMWFLITKKIKDYSAFVRDDAPVVDCIETFGTDKFTAAYWQRAIMAGFMAQRTDDEQLNASILESLRIKQEDYVKRYVGTISLLATLAPLLGLLGTVGGMIKTFEVIAQFGTGNARALASGISEALITTQTGLVVSVPGMFFAGELIRRTNILLERMQRFCLGFSRAHFAVNRNED
jgi:biopolymer transport protein ExbB